MRRSNIIKPFIIGIAGVSGSGKTTISKKLAKKLKAKLIRLDDYWRYHKATKLPSRKEWKKWEHPSSINYKNLIKDIIKISKNQKNKFIIVEGFHILHNKKVRDILNLKIYVSLPNNLIIKRRLEKFGEGDNQKWYSKNIVIKSYKKYGKPTKKYANLIIKGDKNIDKNVKKILKYIIK